MTARWLAALGISLALTLAIELCLALLTGKRGRALLFVALANILTNPAVVLAALLRHAYGLPAEAAAVAVSEALAVLVEGLVYQKSGAGFARPYLFSLAANAVSFGLGLVISVM